MPLDPAPVHGTAQPVRPPATAPDRDLEDALALLREAADAARSWPATTWRASAGPESFDVTLEAGVFEGLPLQPGEYVLTTRFVAPADVGPVPVAGEPLLCGIDSLVPVRLRADGRDLYEEGRAGAAAGPALFEVVGELRPGQTVDLRLDLSLARAAVWNPLLVQLTTPALLRRFDVLDRCWARLFLARELGGQGAGAAAARAAACAALPAELGTLPTATLEALDLHVRDVLAPLADEVRSRTVHVVGHAHIDLAWLWEWDETKQVIERDVASVLALLDEYPELRFTHSQAAGYDVLRQHRPDLHERVVARVAERRWEPATTTWVEHDATMPSGEALARQLLEGVAYSEEHLHARPAVHLAPDTFGQGGNLPQLLTSAGAVACYHFRANPGGHDFWPAYWWQGIDGTRLLAVSSAHYNGEVTAGAIARAAAHAARHGQANALLLHGVGDHGGGPTRVSLERVRALGGDPGLPRVESSTIERYTAAVDRRALPVLEGETPHVFTGCCSAQARTKVANRHAEHRLVEAEVLCSMAGLDAGDEVRAAWRDVLFNQFHDILGGSSIRPVHEQQEKQLAAAAVTAQRAGDEARRVLRGGLSAGTVGVTNPCSFDRVDVATAPFHALDAVDRDGPCSFVGPDGVPTPAQRTAEGWAFLARVPAFSTATYRPAGTAPSQPAPLCPDADDGPYVEVRTDHFTAQVHRQSGAVVGLLDHRTGTQLVGYGTPRPTTYLPIARPDLALNVFQVFQQAPHGMSAWHLDEVRGERYLLDDAAVTVVEDGPVRAVVRVEHRVGDSSVRQDLVFYRELARVDVLVDVDWRERGGPDVGVPGLKLSFTTEQLDAQAWFEGAFGAVRRAAGGQEVPAQRWVDVGGEGYGLAVLNDGVYGHDVLGTRIRLTLARSTYSPDPDGGLGRHTYRLALLPHPGSWRTARVPLAAVAHHHPLVVDTAPPGPTAPAPARRVPRLGSPDGSAVVSAWTRARRGGADVVRVYEPHGTEGRFVLEELPAGVEVWDARVTEEPARRLPVADGRVEVRLGPWEVRTLVLR